MRVLSLVGILFGLCCLLGLLGCNSDDNVNEFFVGGQVVNAVTGDPQPDALLTLFQDGDVVVENITTDINGRFSLFVPEGSDYTVVVRSIGGNFVPLVIGPFRVAQIANNVEIPVNTEQQVLDSLDVTAPPIGTSTLIVGGVDNQLFQIPVTAQAQGRNSIQQGFFAVIQGLTPVPTTVTVRNDGSVRTFANVPLLSGEFTLVNAIFGDYILGSDTFLVRKK